MGRVVADMISIEERMRIVWWRSELRKSMYPRLRRAAELAAHRTTIAEIARGIRDETRVLRRKRKDRDAAAIELAMDWLRAGRVTRTYVEAS
jgi:hypothetical protein